MRHHGLLAMLFSSLLALSACTSSSISQSVGAITGITSGAFTSNPTIGYTIGISMQAATKAGINYLFRTWTHEQQQAMADLASQLPLGEVHAWEMNRIVHYGSEHGQMKIIREIPNALTHCRELVFSVENDDEPSSYYTSSICKNGHYWAWATVDPSVNRWWGLQ